MQTMHTLDGHLGDRAPDGMGQAVLPGSTMVHAVRCGGVGDKASLAHRSGFNRRFWGSTPLGASERMR
jgi:hypothetical protein